MIHRSLTPILWLLWSTGTTMSCLMWLVIVAAIPSLINFHIPLLNWSPAWLLLGLMVGAAQLVLLPKTWTNSRIVWMSLTVLGFGLGSRLSEKLWERTGDTLGQTILQSAKDLPNVEGIIIALAIISSLSMTVGLMQWLWLRIQFKHHFLKTLLWIPANFLGLGLSWLSSIVGGVDVSRDGSSFLFSVLVVIAANAIPGAVMVWLLRQPDFVQRKRRRTFQETVPEL